MKKSLLLAAGCAAAVLSLPQPARAAEDVGAILEKQTQELTDAIAVGGAQVWDRYLHPNVRVTDEAGDVATKTQMLAALKPLPAGVTGSIKVIDWKATVTGDIAVTNYLDDENEDYHGHKVHCQYRQTDTWVKTADGWKMLAEQVLALRTDPPAVELPAKLRAEYVGKYALTADITYEIREKDGGLVGQRSGGKPEEVLKAEAPDVLFVPGNVRYRTIVLRGADGKVRGFAERREAWDIEWKRLP